MKTLIYAELDIFSDPHMYCLSMKDGRLFISGSWDNWSSSINAICIKHHDRKYCGLVVLDIPYGTFQYKWKYNGTQLYRGYGGLGIHMVNGDLWCNDLSTNAYVYDNGHKNQLLVNDWHYNMYMEGLIFQSLIGFENLLDNKQINTYQAIVVGIKNTHVENKIKYIGKIMPQLPTDITKYVAGYTM